MHLTIFITIINNKSNNHHFKTTENYESSMSHLAYLFLNILK